MVQEADVGDTGPRSIVLIENPFEELKAGLANPR